MFSRGFRMFPVVLGFNLQTCCTLFVVGSYRWYQHSFDCSLHVFHLRWRCYPCLAVLKKNQAVLRSLLFWNNEILLWNNTCAKNRSQYVLYSVLLHQRQRFSHFECWSQLAYRCHFLSRSSWSHRRGFGPTKPSFVITRIEDVRFPPKKANMTMKETSIWRCIISDYKWGSSKKKHGKFAGE